MANEANLRKPWKKGESGNPKGAPRKPPSMRDMAEILPDLPTMFARVLSEKNGDITWMEAGIRRTLSLWVNNGSIEAGKLIMAYAYGMPKQKIETESPASMSPPPSININIPAEVVNKVKQSIIKEEKNAPKKPK